MKTTAKVFIWIGMILQFFLIYPIVIGIFALKKLDNPSSSSDLQTWGLLTVFFCSPIGGILMLSVKDSIPAANYYKQPTRLPVTTQRTVVTKNYLDPNDKKRFAAKIAVVILMILYAILLIFIIGFSVVLLVDYNGLSFIPLAISCLQVLATAFFFFAINKKTLPKHINLALTVSLALSISQIPLSVILNYYSVCGSSGKFGFNDWLWSIFGTSFGSLLFSLISLILSIKTKQGTLNCKIVKTKTVVTINHMEVELAEAKRLLDANVITQEEHDRIRNSIIGKYYF